MIHSFHYYACYYALLCLLHYQQQQAASLTIIIDGASTKEWATRDEYQRMMSSPGAASELVGASDPIISAASGSGDDDQLVQPTRHLKERGSSLQKYCGPDLMDVLDLVCNGRFYSGEYEPQEVPPVIKSKRFVGTRWGRARHMEAPSELQDTGEQARQPDTAGIAHRRRKLIDAPEAQAWQAAAGYPPASSGRSLSSYDNINPTNNDNVNDEFKININQQQPDRSNFDVKLKADVDDNRNLVSNSRENRNKVSSLYRRIRGATQDCCARACRLEELRPYCKP